MDFPIFLCKCSYDFVEVFYVNIYFEDLWTYKPFALCQMECSTFFWLFYQFFGSNFAGPHERFQIEVHTYRKLGHSHEKKTKMQSKFVSTAKIRYFYGHLLIARI